MLGLLELSILPCALAERKVDHRYSPVTWHAALGLPDDWHKPMANERGALLYDFGPGPYAQPLTVVEFGLRDQPLQPTGQRWRESRVPIVETTLGTASGTAVAVTTLAVPPRETAPSRASFPRYERLDGITGALGWARPTVSCGPEFRNVAWGTNRPIRYRVRVDAGARKRVALGFCESYKPRLHERVAAMHVEGAAPQTADLALTAPRHAPQVFLFEAGDGDGDGWIDIRIEAPAGRDPNTTLALIAVYAADARLDRETLLGGKADAADPAELRIACGTESLALPGRVDAMEAVFPEEGVPVLKVRTGRRLRADSRGGLWSDEAPFVFTRPRAKRIDATAEGWEMEFPAGTRCATALVFSGRVEVEEATRTESFDFAAAADAVTRRWRASEVPFGRVTVGDSRIQGLVDVAIRTVYQARERLPRGGQFNSSFSLYRGLWAGDAVYMIELAALLGDFARARECLDTLFSFQNSEGLIAEMPPLLLYRTTPAVAWALVRYAQLSGDWAAVESRWPDLLRAVAALRTARETTQQNPGAANAGLLPAGFNDGGIAEIGAEYSSVYWAMIGLRALADAGHRIGRPADATAMARLADDFSGAFEQAHRRDERTDSRGNPYLPVRVGPARSDDPPQLAQWAVLEYHLFGRGTPLESTLLRGTLAMLEAAEIQGLPHSVGWMRDGLWAGYGSLYAHLPLLQGRPAKAADLLYAVANHASPLGGWVEEQAQKAAPPKTAGDQPHVWAASLFARLCLSLLAYERDDTIHLLAGVPAEWLRPGAVNCLREVRTARGPLSLRLEVSSDGKRATLEVDRPAGAPAVVQAAALAAAGFRPDPGTTPQGHLSLPAEGKQTVRWVRD
ncbi:MAG: hypothetical protein HZC55_24955 [Verrucomicrobia bacterium]|nr:hypothetical protein [Verrucomicrobiota bacterium]